MPATIINQPVTETIPAFFVALAQYAVSHKRGQKALAEKDEMLAEHRIVRVSIQTGHATCTARIDMPEYGILAGESFQLFVSNYSDEQGGSYAYIVSDGCSCKSYEFRRQCEHRNMASRYNLIRYKEQVWHHEDELTHVEEGIGSGDFEIEEPMSNLAALTDEIIKSEKRAVAPLNIRGKKYEEGPNGYAVPMAS